MDGARVIAFAATDLIIANVPVSKVGFGVQLDVVRHAMVEGVLEVFSTAGFIRRHAKMVDVAGEVRLAGHADAHIVSDIRGCIGVTATIAI